MRPPFAALLLFVLAGCSNIPGGPEGVIAIEVRVPTPALLEVGDTIQLSARALNQSGDSVAATVVWRAADTTLSIDGAGRATALAPSGFGRVQATVGTLVSSLVSLQLTPHADTLSFPGPDTLRVPLGTDTSAALVAQVLSFNPAGGVIGARLTYQLDPASVSAVEFVGGGASKTVQTGSAGAPLTLVRLHRLSTPTLPDSALITVQAFRPSGNEVPPLGGVRFTVRFDN